MRTFSSLLVVTFIGVRMAWQISYSAASVPLSIGCTSLCHQEGGLYICLPSESNGPNMLDEPLKGFIVTPTCSPWKCFESYKPGHMGVTTHSKSIQHLQSVKLVYQPCSRSWAALEPLRNRWWTLMILMIKMLTNDCCLCYSLFMFTLIMCFALGIETTCCYS